MSELQSAPAKKKLKKSTLHKTHSFNTIETKLEIIRRSENGETSAAIARSYDINRSTIRSILKNKNKIKQYIQNCGSASTKMICKRHGVVMDEMERCLALWIEDQHQKNIPLTFPMVQAKALSLHEELKTRLNQDTDKEFLASKGWFENFKNRLLGRLYIETANETNQFELKDPNEDNYPESNAPKNFDHQKLDSNLTDKHKILSGTVENDTGNEFDTFSRHVSAQLKQMPLYDALICQEKIQTILIKKRLEVLSRTVEFSTFLHQPTENTIEIKVEPSSEEC